MFKPKTDNIEIIKEFYNSKKGYENRINDLEKILSGKTAIYLDEGNIYNSWTKKIGWNIDYKRLYQFFTSFTSVSKIYIYKGTLNNDKKSIKEIAELKSWGYEVITKDVKIMRKDINIEKMVNFQSKSLIKSFIRQSLLDKLNLDEIESLNKILERLNNDGIYYIEDRKCNFDVEMGVDILLDLERGNFNNFIIWTGDSDFLNIIKNIILIPNCKASIFAVGGLISSELNNVNVLKYDIRKIKNFICWNKYLDEDCKLFKNNYLNKAKQIDLGI